MTTASNSADPSGTPSSGAAALRDDLAALRQDIDKLKGAMGEFGRDFGKLAKDGIGEASIKAREVATSAYETSKAAAQSAYEQSRSAANAAGEKVKATKESTAGSIRENPFMAVGIAFGAGLLIGALLRAK